MPILFAEGAASFEELALNDQLGTLKVQVPDAWPNLFRAGAIPLGGGLRAGRSAAPQGRAGDGARLHATSTCCSCRRCATRCSRSRTSPAIRRSRCAPDSSRSSEARSDWAPDPANPLPKFTPPRRVPHGDHAPRPAVRRGLDRAASAWRSSGRSASPASGRQGSCSTTCRFERYSVRSSSRRHCTRLKSTRGRLWESFPPARLLTGLISSDLERGFIILNILLVAFGLWCWLWPVRRGWPSAAGPAWFWVIIETINGVGHPLWSLLQGGHTPGVLTAPVLLVIAVSVARKMMHSSITTSLSEPAQAVYLLVVDGFADWEPAHAVAELRRNGGYRVETAGLTANPVHSMGGITVLPSTTISSVDTADVAVFILPGGDRWETAPVESELGALLGRLDASDVPIAAICAATVAIARIGLLKGRRHTSNGFEHPPRAGPRLRGRRALRRCARCPRPAPHYRQRIGRYRVHARAVRGTRRAVARGPRPLGVDVSQRDAAPGLRVVMRRHLLAIAVASTLVTACSGPDVTALTGDPF